MANRRFEQFQLTLEKKVVTLWASVAVGASGAPTLSTTKSKGIKSVVRNSAGNYTVSFQDAYQYLMFLDSCIVLASGAPSTGSAVQIVVRSDSSASSTAPAVVIECLGSSGTAVELTSGATLTLTIQLKNSTV